MHFSELDSDVITKIMVAACDEQQLNHLSRVNRYTRTTLFSAPLSSYGDKDQANIYLLRGRYCLARYGSTLAKADLMQALRYIMYAYSLNDKLDKLWLENITDLVSRNIPNSPDFQDELLRWLTELLTDEQCLLHDKPQWLYYFMGLIYYQPIAGRINLLLDELSLNPGLWLTWASNDRDENLASLFDLEGDPQLAQRLECMISCFEKAAAMGNLAAITKLYDI